MEDDYQITLIGKIKILYQLEKWQDVIKLCEEYDGAYGKDIEVDMIRYKSEQHFNKTVPVEKKQDPIMAPESKAQKNQELLDTPEIVAEEEPPLLLTADHVAVQNPVRLVNNEIPAVEKPMPEKAQISEPFPNENELIIIGTHADDEPEFTPALNEPPELVHAGLFGEEESEFSPDPNEPPDVVNELIITDSFTEDKPVFSQAPNEPSPEANELIITDFFAENEPVFSLAHNEPPVILVDSGKAENVPIQIAPRAEEMAIVEENPGEFVNTKIAFDYKSDPAMAFDVEPILAPNSAVVEESAKVWDETSVATVKEIAPEPKFEPAVFKINEREKTLATEFFTEMADEKPQPVGEPYINQLKKTKSPKKFAFNFKYILLLILPLIAAVILWLALSGKLNLDGGGSEKVNPVSAVKSPVPVMQRPAQKVSPALLIPQTDEKDQLVNEKILQANNFIKNGDILNALAVVLEAKKIKLTAPLRLLEEQITEKIREDETRAAEQKKAVQSMVQSEDQVYAKAETENTLAAWQNFLLQYPQGEFTARARNKIVVLQKKAAQKAEQELQLKIQQAQKLKLRSEYINLNQAELNTALQQLGKSSAQFEQLEHGGEKVIIDFSSGLMWTLWNKPMGFDKAKWWANRIYAGYAGWRLPTVEESLTLLQMDTSLYASLADFAVWTGDGVSNQAHSIWALRLPQGKFIPEDYSQVYYVWAVRKAGK